MKHFFKTYLNICFVFVFWKFSVASVDYDDYKVLEHTRHIFCYITNNENTSSDSGQQWSHWEWRIKWLSEGFVRASENCEYNNTLSD